MSDDIEVDLPPVLPEQRDQLTRAVMLLGERAKGTELRQKHREELTGLVGVYPEPAQAAAWKRALRALREELDEELA